MDDVLFEKNMKVLEDRLPVLAAEIKALGFPTSTLVEQHGSYNIDLGNRFLYHDGAHKFLETQFEDYEKNPIISAVSRFVVSEHAFTDMQFFGAAAYDFAKERDLIDGMPIRVAFPSHIVVFGLGLGLHIDRILDTYEIRNIILVEDQLEFVYHAMHVVDFANWYEKLNRNGGHILFVKEDDPANVFSKIHRYLSHKDTGFINGWMVYQHYSSASLNKGFNELIRNRRSFSGKNGFFEDEIIMMENFLGNVSREDAKFFPVQAPEEKNIPALVIGSGPSLDKSIELVKTLQDKVVIISCGTSLGALLRYGVRPDIHVEIENAVAPYDSNKSVSEQFDLSGIRLICTYTILPKHGDLFDDATFFFRDSVSSSVFFEPGGNTLAGAVPTVTNTGTRVAIGLGFTSIYLIGVDLGARNQDTHHSKNAIYYKNKDFVEKYSHIDSTYNFTIPMRGNFGGTIYTNTVFQLSSVFLSLVCKYFKNVEIFNLSDGVLLEKTIPQMPESLDLTRFDNDGKSEALSQVDRHLIPKGIQDYVYWGEITELKECMSTIINGLGEMLDKFSNYPFDLIELYDVLIDCIELRSSTDFSMKSKVTATAFFSGSWQSYYMTLCHVLNRIPDEYREECWSVLHRELQSYLVKQEKQVFALLDDMLARAIERGCAETRPQ